MSLPANGAPDIVTAAMEGDAAHPRLGESKVFLATPFADVDPVFSPDGRWLAYASNDSGTYETYVRPFPGPGGKWQISVGNGRFPRWTRDGRELLYERSDNTIMAATYTAKGDVFTPGVPHAWAPTRILESGVNPNYDLMPDGKRIVALMPADDAEGQKPFTHLTFLLNFFDELRRKAPGKN